MSAEWLTDMPWKIAVYAFQIIYGYFIKIINVFLLC